MTRKKKATKSAGKVKKYPIRTVLSIGNLFYYNRLEVMAFYPDEQGNAHYRVNPNQQFSDRPVVDEITMRVVTRIQHIMADKHGEPIATIFVAGHLINNTPSYYTSTYGDIYAVEINRLLKVITQDCINDYATPSAVAYMRRLRQQTNTSSELIKRVLNAWAIATLVLEDERVTLTSLDKVTGVDYAHPRPVSLL